MFKSSLPVLAAVLLVISTGVKAQAEDAEVIPDAAPTLPSQTDNLEPEVTIIQRGGETVEEYRINGQLYLIKVVPSKGYPYYLMDTDGDGSLESRRDELDPRMLVPAWVIFRW